MHDTDPNPLPADDPRVADVSGPPGGITGKGRPRRRRKKSAPVVQPPDWRGVDPADLSNPALYINRELSWLEFNQRVLAQAQDASHPLLERVKFLAITGTNLDEFFMVRRGDAS